MNTSKEVLKSSGIKMSKNKNYYIHGCINCNKAYKNRTSLRRHMKYECGPAHLFQCVYCTTSMRQKYDLKKHVRRMHPEKCEEFDAIYKQIYPRSELKNYTSSYDQ